MEDTTSSSRVIEHRNGAIHIDDKVLECFTDGSGDTIDLSTKKIFESYLEEFEHSLQALGYSDRDVFGIVLGVTEAYQSAVEHGDGKIMLNYHIGSECARFTLKDHGLGFDPSTVPDPTHPDNIDKHGGRGIHLMVAYLDRVTYSTQGNCVEMIRNKGSSRPEIDED